MADQEDREIIITPYGRLSFPHLAAATKYDATSEAKFDAALLYPKPETIKETRYDDEPVSPWGKPEKHDLTSLRQIITDYVDETWPNPKTRPDNLKLPIQDGDTKKWEGYADNFFTRTTSMRPPKLIDARKNLVVGDDIERVFYAGCWVRAIINPFDYKKKGNIGVSLGLQALQFIRDDKPFSGGINAQEAFDDIPDDDLAPDDLDDME